MELLSEDNLITDPLRIFSRWYGDAQACAEIPKPEAMCLATVCSDGYPEGRMVLLKESGARGFIFGTNTLSTKGRALSFAPRAEMVFYWGPLGRQVRLQGDVVPLRNDEADALFAARPRGAQLSAWAAMQSRAVDDREELEKRRREEALKYLDKDVPRPPHWGGYRLVPRRIEFWQERDDRLHDRFRYLLGADGVWKAGRLAP